MDAEAESGGMERVGPAIDALRRLTEAQEPAVVSFMNGMEAQRMIDQRGAKEGGR